MSSRRNEFGRLLRKLRIRAGFGLRQFAGLVGEHPPNYYAVEAGTRTPWCSLDKLAAVAQALALQRGTTEWDRFFLAARGSTSLPPDLKAILDRDLNLVLLRTVHDLRLSDETLGELVKHVRNDWGRLHET